MLLVRFLCILLLLVGETQASFPKALREWKVNVQNPALGYPQYWGWVYYSDSVTPHSGGLADRMIGVMNALLLAVHSGRGFGIEWGNLRTVLRSPRWGVAWDRAPPVPHDAVSVLCQADFGGCRDEYMRLASTRRGATIRLSSNQNWVDGVTQTPQFMGSIQRLYNVTGPPTHLAHAYQLVFDELFEGSHILLPKPVVCVQIRMGKGGGQPWEDTETFLTDEGVQTLAEFVRKTWPTQRLFLTTDSSFAAHRFGDLVGHDRLLFPAAVTGTMASHIDRSPDPKFAGVVSHFLTLRTCDAGIITERSGFGRCGIWLKGTPRQDDYLGKFYVVLKNQTIINFCDYSVGDCVPTTRNVRKQLVCSLSRVN